MSHLDPTTIQYNKEVQQTLDLQSVAQNMSDILSNLDKVMRSHIPATNVPARIYRRPRKAQSHPRRVQHPRMTYHP